MKTTEFSIVIRNPVMVQSAVSMILLYEILMVWLWDDIPKVYLFML